MMKIRAFITIFQLSAIYSIAISANAGSSATAITSITANIVPAASFSVTKPILLSQQAENIPPITSAGHRENTANSASANRVILKTTGSETASNFRVKSSQNLAYDISMPLHVSVSDNKSSITANISHTLNAHGQLNIDEAHELNIDGALKDAAEQNTGAYRGLIDITVNYN